MLSETLQERASETLGRERLATGRIRHGHLEEASHLSLLNFSRRRFLRRKQSVALRLAFLHNDAVALAEEDTERVTALYSDTDLRECLETLTAATARLKRDGYKTRDALPTLNDLITQVAAIHRDRVEVRQILKV